MIDFVKKPDELEDANKPASQTDAPDLSRKAFEEKEKPKPWNSTPQGRLAIRTFSRGIMGAMFFTAGGLLSRRLMFGERGKDYVLLNNHSWESRYESDKTFGQILHEKNPLQFIAKTIDTFVGMPIEATVNFFHGDGKNAVRFRETQYKIDPNRIKDPTTGRTKGSGPDKDKYFGRSLGFEAVHVTFDFFCASIGDAVGRDMVGWFDPTVKKDWMDDKGHVKFPEAVKTLTKSLWRYVSYNGGEDWAVAIPYAYFMKAQRSFIDQHSPGFRYDFDASMNGGSFKVRQFGSDPHYNVVGSYNLEGIFDLQTRFTVYNIGTLLFREAYDKAAHIIKGDNINLYGAPDAPVDPNRSILAKTGDVAKWALRGTIKGIINMTPAVPFFWVTRGMQSKHRGLFIDPEKNAALAFKDESGRPHYFYANDIKDFEGVYKREDGVTETTPVFFSRFDGAANNGNGEIINSRPMSAEIGNPASRDGYNPYQKRHNVAENAFSKIGETGYQFSKLLDGPAEWLSSNFNDRKKLRGALGLRTSDKHFKRFTRPFINASVSYTPYMYMKAETARLWDSGKMDYALERTIDGATAFNWGEFRAGLGETFNALLHKPFDDEKREQEAQRRIRIDTSQAADMTDEDAAQLVEQEKQERQRLRQRILAEESPESAPTEKDGWHTQLHKQKPASEGFAAKEKTADKPHWRERMVQGPRDEASQTVDKKASYSEREELRRALEEAQPLTNSVH